MFVKQRRSTGGGRNFVTKIDLWHIGISLFFLLLLGLISLNIISNGVWNALVYLDPQYYTTFSQYIMVTTITYQIIAILFAVFILYDLNKLCIGWNTSNISSYTTISTRYKWIRNCTKT